MAKQPPGQEAKTQMKAKIERVKFTVDKAPIKQTENLNLLGITICSTGTWNYHIKEGKTSVINQLKTRINAMRKLVKNACNLIRSGPRHCM